MTRRYKVKCPYCEKSFYREEESYVEYKKRFYHKECYNIIKNQENDKEALEEYIKELYGIKGITPLIRTQIKKYITEEHFTYSGMLGTLRFFYEIKKGDLTKAKGIGIIPYIYEDAKAYYSNLKSIVEENKTVVLKSEIKKIKITKPVRKPMRGHKIEINTEDCLDE